MKKFAVSVLTISVFFVGLGSLAEKVGAKFKSDEKALEIIGKARTAIGGDAALAQVRSLVITGKSTHTIKIGDAERAEPGEMEIALQFPDQLSQKFSVGTPGEGHKMVMNQVDVTVVTKTKDGVGTGEGRGTGLGVEPGQKIIIKKDDGTVQEVNADVVIERNSGGTGESTWTTKDGKTFTVKEMPKDVESGVWKSKDGQEKHMVLARTAEPGKHGFMRQNELLRLSLSLLLTAPEGIDVNYTFAGESDVDGTAVNIVNAEFGGANYKLYIGKSTNLPVAMSYLGHGMPAIAKFTKEVPPPADGQVKDTVIFKRAGPESQSEHFVRFSDYRSTNGVQLPYKWTTTVGGAPRDTFEVTSYDVNPANIAEKFKDQKVFVRTKKANGQ